MIFWGYSWLFSFFFFYQSCIQQGSVGSCTVLLRKKNYENKIIVSCKKFLTIISPHSLHSFVSLTAIDSSSQEMKRYSHFLHNIFVQWPVRPKTYALKCKISSSLKKAKVVADLCRANPSGKIQGCPPGLLYGKHIHEHWNTTMYMDMQAQQFIKTGEGCLRKPA